MIKEIKKLILVAIMAGIVFAIFYNIKFDISKINAKEAELVIYGENILTEYKPFVSDGGIYVSVDTVDKVIDPHIYYDKVATKVIVTTENELVKFKMGENKMYKNFEVIDTATSAKIVDGEPFVDINMLRDIYGIKVEYNQSLNTISIDKKDTSDIPIKNNMVYVYNDISTKSRVNQILNCSNTVTVYTESLEHNRWYKVKTDSGVVGFIAKNSIEISVEENNKIEGTEPEQKNNKFVMFWQYGSNLNALGKEKIEGVDVVSPTWYELKNSNGDISSKYSAEYISKAKSYGYKVWPIITNGIDSASYDAEDTSTMLNSEYNRENFIKNIVATCKKDGVDGINVDFEAMKTDDRNIYTQFIRELAPILRTEGITLSVDMYFVNYIDRKGVGAACDYVVLMGYDQRGAWSNETGSIAEVSWVEGNIESLINDSNIPSSKIILGIPFYTRLWTVTSGSDKLTTKVYTMDDCEEFIKDNKLTPSLDEKSGQNYVEYTKGKVTYKLWIEDKTSVERRIQTVNNYNLAGVTCWRKGFETDDIWDVINKNIQK